MRISLPSQIPCWKQHPVISNGHVNSKVSLQINAAKFRFLAVYGAMTAKMNNTVCCFKFSGPLRSISVYIGPSAREGGREKG